MFSFKIAVELIRTSPKIVSLFMNPTSKVRNQPKTNSNVKSRHLS